MEELATTSAHIAESVDAVAARTQQTQTALQGADDGMTRSSERIAALADRAVEIGQIVTLINEIADKTNLLALNAADRGGARGRGRRGLRRRGRGGAPPGGALEGRGGEDRRDRRRTQAETNATSWRWSPGSKDMRRGLELMHDVTDSTSEVRLTTDQQRIATDQVVQTMVSVSTATKQTATTAQQIAGRLERHRGARAQLERVASSFRTRTAAEPPLRGGRRVPLRQLAGRRAALPPRSRTRREPAVAGEPATAGRTAPSPFPCTRVTPPAGDVVLGLLLPVRQDLYAVDVQLVDACCPSAPTRADGAAGRCGDDPRARERAGQVLRCSTPRRCSGSRRCSRRSAPRSRSCTSRAGPRRSPPPGVPRTALLGEALGASPMSTATTRHRVGQQVGTLLDLEATLAPERVG
jgi:hypothetical protein